MENNGTQEGSATQPAVSVETQHVDQQPVGETSNIASETKEEVKPVITATQEFEVSSTDIPEEMLKMGIPITFPPSRNKEIADFLNSIPNLNLANSKENTEWLERLTNGRTTRPLMEWGDGAVERENAMFEQVIKSDKGGLAISTPRLGDNIEGKISGEKAVMRVKSMIGLGTTVLVPLWHSGFWVSIKAPSDSAMLELNRLIAEEKITLGRSTWGLAFSASSVFFDGWLIDFALQHVYDSTLKPEAAAQMKDLINQLDIPILLWGLACAQWPKGFAFKRPLMTLKDGEEKFITEKLNIGKLLWVDRNSFTPWQISHMANKFGNSMTLESLERYRSDFTRGKGKEIEVFDNIKVTLKTPTIDEYLTSGQKWVNNIVTMIDKSLNEDVSEEMRNSYIMDQGKASTMRQFAHFIKTITIGDAYIEDRETVEDTVDALSGKDEVRDAFFNGIKNYIEESTIAIIAIPAVDGIERNEDGSIKKPDLPRFPHLLPLDVKSVFFTLLVQKVMLIELRE